MSEISSASALIFPFRVALPLLCICPLTADPHRALWALLLLGVTSVDVLMWRRQGMPVTGRLWTSSVLRDIGYATVFYLAYLPDGNVLALALAPAVIAEITLTFPRTIIIAAFGAEILLIGFRMVYFGHRGHWLDHPVWPEAVIIATLLAYWISQPLKRTVAARQEAQEIMGRARAVLGAVQFAAAQDSSNYARRLSEQIGVMLQSPCDAVTRQECTELTQQLARWLVQSTQSVRIFTAREEEVLRLIIQGATYGNIAASLQVSKGTVRAHAASIMRKTSAHNRSELLAWIKTNHGLERYQEAAGGVPLTPTESMPATSEPLLPHRRP